eukprot:g2233.t1
MVKKLTSQTCTSISVQPPRPGAESQRILVSGSKLAVEEATNRIQEILRTTALLRNRTKQLNEERVSKTTIVPSFLAHYLPGKDGCQFERIKKDTGVFRISICSAALDEDKVTIIGPSLKSVEKALSDFEALVSKTQSRVKLITVPDDAVGLLIGKGAKNARRIYEATQAWVSVGAKGAGERRVIVAAEDSSEQLGAALAMIKELLAKGDCVWTDEAHETLHVKARDISQVIGKKGSNFRRIESETSTTIESERKEFARSSNDLVQVTVHGAAANVEQAMSRLKELVLRAARRYAGVLGDYDVNHMTLLRSKRTNLLRPSNTVHVGRFPTSTTSEHLLPVFAKFATASQPLSAADIKVVRFDKDGYNEGCPVAYSFALVTFSTVSEACAAVEAIHGMDWGTLLPFSSGTHKLITNFAHPYINESCCDSYDTALQHLPTAVVYAYDRLLASGIATRTDFNTRTWQWMQIMYEEQILFILKRCTKKNAKWLIGTSTCARQMRFGDGAFGDNMITGHSVNKSAPRGRCHECQIFVRGDLVRTSTASDMKAYFEKYADGRVRSINVLASKGYCFVEFAHAASVEKILGCNTQTELWVGGSVLYVKRARPSRNDCRVSENIDIPASDARRILGGVIERIANRTGTRIELRKSDGPFDDTQRIQIAGQSREAIERATTQILEAAAERDSVNIDGASSQDANSTDEELEDGEIVEVAKMTEPALTTEKIEINSSIIGRLLGRGGQALRDLEMKSGARIDVMPKCGHSHQVVFVSGSEVSTRQATSEIQERILEAEQELRQLSSDPRYRTKLCTRYMDGHCCYGTFCMFAHGMGELRSAPKRAAPCSSADEGDFPALLAKRLKSGGEGPRSWWQ